MKNTRSYRFTAILLAAVMVLSILPTMAGAAGNIVLNVSDKYIYNATDSASFSFASDGKAVNGVSDLDPNKTSTMTVTVPQSNGLPKDQKGEVWVKLPDYVELTGQNATACKSDTVTCEYWASTNMLKFKWKGEPAQGFSAIFTITPDTPATREDISGSHVITIKNNNKAPVVMQAKLKDFSGVKRLTAVEGQLVDNSIVGNAAEVPVWTIRRITGDWYSISCNGQYLNFGMNGNNMSLTGTPQYFLYTREGAGNQFVAFAADGTKYFLNNKSHNISNGIQASTYNDQSVILYDRIKATADQALLLYSINGGSVATKFAPVYVAPGTIVTLPDYSGQKRNGAFIGWSLYSNIYDNHDGTDNTYCEVYLPGTEYKVPAGETTLYAVYNEKGTDVRFGFRIDGTIPNEPGSHSTKEYTGHMSISGALKIGRWVVDVDGNKPIEGNHVANNVAANLNRLPSDEEIKEKIKTYDPETMYVHWYVLKYAGQWKVDGVIRTRTAYSVGYDMNMEGENRNYIQNMPNGFEFIGQSEITVGAEKDGTVKTPSLDGFIFDGWKDDAGRVYEPGTPVTVSGSVTYYAQWREIPKYNVTFDLANAAKNAQNPEDLQVREDGTVVLPEVSERDGYVFSGWSIGGEKIQGDSFTMPAENVKVEGTYYGPINIEIESDWPDGKVGFIGAKVTLTARTTGPENLDYTYQWQYSEDGSWKDVSNATGVTYTYELNEETSGRVWRVIITDARPHQD